MVWRMLRRPIAVAVAAVSVVGAGCANDPAPAPPIAIGVVHGAKHTSLRVRPGTTVAQVLERLRVRPHEGQVVAAKSGTALVPNGRSSTIRVRGRTVEPTMTLRRPSTVVVVDATDTVEATRTERRTVEPPGMPKAIQYVQHVGQPGVDMVTVGARSGEVVARRTVVEAVPVHRATGKVISLTFDDGPSPTWTPQVLAILADRKVPATFCQVGAQVEAHPELTRQVVDDGHQLCNHTEHHVEQLEDQPRATVVAEITGGRAALTTAGGEPPYYRPPGGSLGPAIYEVAGDQGEHVLYWSTDPRDWKHPPAADIAAAVINQLEPGAVVLLHDGGGDRANTVAALPAIIDFARALGYTFTFPVSGRPQVG